MTRQGTVEASTSGGLDNSLLEHQLDGRTAYVDSLQTAYWVRLAVISSADEAFRNLGTFEFLASQLFSTGGATCIIINGAPLIERLEELHTEVQVIITYPHLETELIYDVLQKWSL